MDSLDSEKKEDILREFEDSKEGKSHIDIDSILIFEEHDQIWIVVEDLYYGVDDSLSRRTFSVNECQYMNSEHGHSFEEC